jgi:aspartyl-tRNA(Asn)/glutamyl-tRNA(Gln) amidotransferase subunit A
MSEHTIDAITACIQDGSRSAEDIYAAYRERVEQENPRLNALIHLYSQDQTDTEAAGELSGVPIAVKDNMLVKGEPVTAASNILQGYHASYDATAVANLRAAGARFMGATNMDEFAMGSSGEHSYYGATVNPHGSGRVPGGSSSGSAAAVAAGLVPAALGSDTGGSIRQPASFCGIVGFKPTYGAISRSGLIAMGSSLDQIGTLTNTVADARQLFRVMRGQDAADSTTLPDSAFAHEESAAEPTTIGVPRHLFGEGVDEDVVEQFEVALQSLEQRGYTVKEVSLPSLRYALAAYYIIMPAEVSSNLARFDGVRYGLYRQGRDLLGDYMQTRQDGFGDEPRRRILLGTYMLSEGYYDAYYGQAMRVRQLIRQDLERIFEDVDVIATPTSPTPAFRIGETTDPLTMYMQDAFTVPANLAGIPALSVPAGPVARDGDQLPTGLQLMAPHTYEERLFTLGRRYTGEA